MRALTSDHSVSSTLLGQPEVGPPNSLHLCSLSPTSTDPQWYESGLAASLQCHYLLGPVEGVKGEWGVRRGDSEHEGCEG